MRTARFVFVCISVLTAFDVTAAQNEELRLAATERAAIEAAACRERHEVALERINGRVYGAGTRAPAVAEAHCVSNQSINGSPAHYVVQCSRSDGKWECQGEWIEMLVPVTGADSIAVRVEGEMKSAQATQVIQKIAAAGRFQGYELRKALAPPCYVTQMKGKEFIDVKCEGWHIIVSTWCPQSEDCPRLLSIAKD